MADFIRDNVAPGNYYGGVKDNSTRKQLPAQPDKQQFKPISFGYAAKGPTTPVEETLGGLKVIFGDDTFAESGDYASHPNVGFATILGAGIKGRFRRLKPADAKEAQVAVYMIVSDEYTSKPFKRDTLTGRVLPKVDFKYQLDGDADDIQVRTISLATRYAADGADLTSPVTGTMDVVGVDGNTTTVNYTAYPIMKVDALAHGKYYNNTGFSIKPLIGEELDGDVYNSGYLGMSFRALDKEQGLPETILSKEGAETVEFVFKNGVQHPTTGVSLDLARLYKEDYTNLTDTTSPIVVPAFDKIKVDSTLYKTVMGVLATTLLKDANRFGIDYDTVEGNEFKVNGITAKGANGIEYENVRLPDINVTIQGDTLTPKVADDNVSFYLGGGEDGSITDLNKLEEDIVNEVAKYADLYSEYIDMADNHERQLVDTGYKLENAVKLAKFIAIRPDTAVILGTYTWNEDDDTPSLATELARANLLTNAVRAFPESPVFGTPTFRGSIILGSVNLENSTYKHRLPATVDYCYKLAKYAGATSGELNGTYQLAGGTNSHLVIGKDYEPSRIPMPVYNQLAKAQLIVAKRNQNGNYYYTSHQSVYGDTSSVLDTTKAGIMLGTIARIDEWVWSQVTGIDYLPTSEFLKNVETEFQLAVAGLFDSEPIVIKLEVFQSPRNEASGNSYTLVVNFYGQNALIKQNSYTIVDRLSALKG